MKLRKVVASFAASALALSAMTVSAGAIDAGTYMRDGDTNYTVFVRADKEADPNWSADTGNTIDNIYGVTYTFSVAQADVDAGTWFGGKIGVNSNSAGWKEFCTWGTDAETIKVTIEDCKFDVTYLGDAPVFAEADGYAQFWCQSYGGAITTEAVKLLAADGSEIGAVEAPAEEAATGAFTAEFGAQFDSSTTDEWPSFADKTVAFDYDKEVTMTLDMGKAVKFGGNYIALNTNVPYVEGMTADITSFKLDGAEVEMGAAYLNNEGTDGGLRLTILNLWNADIAEQPVDAATLGEFQTIEITFIVNTPAAEDEAAEDDTAEDDAEAAEDEDDTAAEDDAAIEPDWDSYDEDAMAKMNEEFVLGGNIDIYSVVGDDWADIAKVEADFVWTPGLGGWCGGAGIGNGAVAADGSTWISGPEYGAANANSKYEPDGKATQVLVDLSENPLTAIASVNEDGTTAFAQVMVQNWWNGVEANAQVAAVRFLDADGEVIGELTYDVDVPEAPAADEEAPAEDTAAPEAGDVDAATDSSKGSPDTGVEDVAVVAGLAIVAAGAVLVSKKRK